MYKDTVTIFNLVEDKENGTALWYPKVLHNVELQICKGIQIANTGNNNADTARLHIKTTPEVMEFYKKPKEYMKMEDHTGYFTLKPEDFFVIGEFEEVIDENMYPSGFFEYMKKDYDDVYNITTVDFYKTIPHFEVGGN